MEPMSPKRKFKYFLTKGFGYLNLIFKVKEKIDVSEYTIISDKITPAFDGYRILHLSDLHSHQFNDNNQLLINKINDINPDLILVSGDMVGYIEDRGEVFLDLVKRVEYPFVVSYGNHEILNPIIYEDNYYRHQLEALGVCVLINESYQINKDQEHITISGNLLDYHEYISKIKDSKVTVEQLQAMMPAINQNEFNILLAHTPSRFSLYQQLGYDLTLSGHIHGGMIRFFKQPFLSPEVEFFPKYAQGLNKINDKYLIVSRGIGYGSTPLRIKNNPEIGVITLKSRV